MGEKKLTYVEYREYFTDRKKAAEVFEPYGNKDTSIDIDYYKFVDDLKSIDDDLSVKIFFNNYISAPVFKIYYQDVQIGVIYLSDKLSFSFNGSYWGDKIPDEAKLKIINLCIEYTK